jgi:hypothetical protein
VNNFSDRATFSIHLFSESSIHMLGIFIHILSESSIHMHRNPQESQQVVERPVFEHQNDYVFDS